MRSDEDLDTIQTATATRKKARKKGISQGTIDLRCIEIPPMNIAGVTIGIWGMTTLVVQNFHEKSVAQMEEIQQGPEVRNKKTKPKRKPMEEYQAAFHRFADGRYGFPADAFKKILVAACRAIEGISMTQMEQVVQISFECEEDLFEIHSVAGPHMRTDHVRIGKPPNKVAQIRYRPEFPDWWIECKFEVNTDQIHVAQVVAVLERAGFGVGLGEWRPTSGGNHGRFRVLKEAELENLRAGRSIRGRKATSKKSKHKRSKRNEA